MDIATDSRQVTRLEIVDTGRRRRWSEEAKLRIVEESYSAPRQASATARRHGISNPLLFAWRKAHREGRLGEGGVCGFVPAVIVPEQQPKKGREPAGGRMEVVSANGRRVIVEPDVDVEALLRIMRGLETLR
jgi:transposase